MVIEDVAKICPLMEKYGLLITQDIIIFLTEESKIEFILLLAC